MSRWFNLAEGHGILGLRLDAASGNPHHVLPRPATGDYVVDIHDRTPVVARRGTVILTWMDGGSKSPPQSENKISKCLSATFLDMDRFSGAGFWTRFGHWGRNLSKRSDPQLMAGNWTKSRRIRVEKLVRVDLRVLPEGHL